MTREACRTWNQYWPTTFRQPAWRPVVFDDSELVRGVIEMHLSKLKQDPDRGTSYCAHSCMIALGKHRAAEAAEIIQEQSSHPLGHAPMRALKVLAEAVTRLQEAETRVELIRQQPALRDRVGRRRSPNGVSSSSYSSQEETTSASSSSIENVNQRKRPYPEEYSVAATAPPAASSDHLFIADTPLLSSQYYATACVAYCSAEPCVMCSMGLLHSRVSAVIFPTQRVNKTFGGLGGSIALHTDVHLNHSFRVLRVALAPDLDPYEARTTSPP